MLKFSKYLFALLVISQLSACVTAAVGTAAVGGSIIADRRSSGIIVEDQNIEIKAFGKIEKNLSDASHVSVTSYNRNILLTGEVPNEEQKTKAETLIKTIPNIRSIANELVIAPKTTIKPRSIDALVTSKVKANFAAERSTAINHVKVVTERKVVYLMGLVTKAEGQQATQIARTTDGVTKVVKLFEYLP